MNGNGCLAAERTSIECERIGSSPPHGHNIELNVVMDHARIEDLLQLGVKTEPAVLSGAVALTASLSLPPGSEDVSDRLQLPATFAVPEGRFSK